MFHANRMSWRHGRPRRLRLAGLLLLAGAWQGTRLRAETPPKPAGRVPLSALGFPGYSVSLLHAGASMATIHMLDSTHVLFTYSLRSLVPRLPGDDVNDTDRQVAAVLVEAPSGKVLSRATWHLHDHGRYLWNVGPGVFVIRIGNDLSVLAPLQGLQAGQEPFRRYSLPHRPGQPVLVTGSPDGKVVTVEMESERQAVLGDEDTGPRRPKHYTLEFFRLAAGDKAGPPIQISGAGAVGSPVLLRLALDGDGYLWAEDKARGRWEVSFNEFGGKQENLAPVLSSCHPRLNLLSRSQFMVETCRGTDQEPMLAAYGFDGHENWQEPFGESLQPPTLALAPEAGRFAMSRLVASSGGAPVSGLGNDDPLSQEIRVYQTESGDMLLHVQCAPAVRSAENFDLSSDGRTLVVLGPETMDFYKLPELNARDRKDLAEVQAMTPPPGSGPVGLAKITRPIEAPLPVGGGDAVRGADEPPAAVAGGEGAATLATAAGIAASAATAPPPAARLPDAANGSADRKGLDPDTVSGDPAAGTPRKAPTLLNPGEKPEFKGQSTTPK